MDLTPIKCNAEIPSEYVEQFQAIKTQEGRKSSRETANYLILLGMQKWIEGGRLPVSLDRSPGL